MDELDPEVEKRMIPKIEGLDQLIGWLMGFIGTDGNYYVEDVTNLLAVLNILKKIKAAQS